MAYQWEPRLLKHLPSPENNEVTVRTVRVLGGARYVDETGAIQTNNSGQTLALPQLVVTFTLKSALRWSDGDDLTSEDVLLGFHLAQDPDARGTWSELVKRTASFETLDDSLLRWTGLPGCPTGTEVLASGGVDPAAALGRTGTNSPRA